MANNVLVIGASGGIASAIIDVALADDSSWNVFAISRREKPVTLLSNVHWTRCDSSDEAEIAQFVDNCKQDNLTFSRIICCSGVLHSPEVTPEKRLEDIQADALLHYMATNFVVPALWIKHAPKLIDKSQPSTVAVLSARVGSITDNRLGGWYGYRASKSALNMMVKSAQIEYGRRLPKTALIVYHPGTVDTELSKPFQANVKPGKLFTPAFTAKSLWREMRHKSADNGPYYIDYQGQEIPW